MHPAMYLALVCDSQWSPDVTTFADYSSSASRGSVIGKERNGSAS